MRKPLTLLVVLFLSLGLFLTQPPTVGLTQGEIKCEQEVLVQTTDTLSTIAGRIYGDVLAFPAIVEATNQRATVDGSYAKIDNPNLVEIGWKLCIPAVADAEALLAKPAVKPETAAVGLDGDRIGFPTGYEENFTIFYEFDRRQNQSARVIYANQTAASVQPGQPFPYGSILAMEVHRTKKNEAGEVLLDDRGRFVRDALFGLFVMRKEPGFGTRYGLLRNGEWEYVAYRPDGTVFIPTERTNGCAACHMEAGQGRDWVFGAHRFFGEQVVSPDENEVLIVDYAFQPETLTVQVGTEVKWTSQDVVFHTVTASDQSLSGVLRPEQSFSHTFEETGIFEYFSALYPNVKGRIEVVN